MASLTTNDLWKGLIIDLDGVPFEVVDFQHVKPGKGGAFVRTKLKNLKISRVIEKTFNSKEPVTEIRIDEQEAQYLYGDASSYNFMDTQTYETISLSAEFLGDNAGFLKEGLVVKIQSYNKKILSVQLPTVVEYKVTETAPDVRGNTAAGGTKPATLETGSVIQVPFFIAQGEVVKVDTRTGQYLERKK